MKTETESIEQLQSKTENLRRRIAELEESEKALKQAQKDYRDFVDSIDGIVWEADARTFEFSFVSKRAEWLLGYPTENWISDPSFWREHIHPDDRDWAVSFCCKATAEKRSHDFEYRMIAADGRAVWLKDVVTVIVKDDQPAKLRGVMIDITGRKRAEEESHLLKTIALAIGETDDLNSSLAVALREVCRATGWALGQAWTPRADGSVLECNPAWHCETSGLEDFRTASEGFVFEPGVGLPGRVWLLKRPAWIQDATANANFMRAGFARRSGLKAGMAVPVIAGGEVIAVMEFFVFEPRQEDGRLLDIVSAVAAHLGLAIQRKKAEQALRESEARLQAIMDNTTAVVYMLDAEGRYLFINHRWEDLFHIDKKNVVGGTVHDFFPAEVAEALNATNREVLRTGIPSQTEERIPLADGVHTYISVKFPLRDASGAPYAVCGISTDITEIKQTEAALREAEMRYRDLFENANDLIYTHDLEGNFTSANRKASQFTGYTIEEITGLNVAQILAPGYLALASENISRKLAGETDATTYQIEIIHKDGTQLPVEVSSRLIYEGDRPIGVQGIARDISERIRLEQQLRQSQKMEAIGRLAGGVAHDFNNLLTAIIGYSHLALSRLAADDPLREEIREIKLAGKRAAALTSQLLAFSRKQVLQPVVLNLNEVISNMVNMLRRVIGEDIELIKSLDPLIGQVKADPGQIEQVILNLAVNARDAMPRGGKLVIETANLCIENEHSIQHPEVQPGRYVALSVSDTGCGMDQQTLSRIFEPFFTTKSRDKGTGLGLSTVYGIIEQSGGHLEVTSEPGRGTTFRIYLQRTDEPADNSPRLDEIEMRIDGTETVLLVEDDALVRKLAADILRERGYTVYDVSAGEDAYQVIEDKGEEIDLLLTDVVMPMISGREIADKIRTAHEKVKVLFMSGYMDDIVLHHSAPGEDIPFLKKPFTPIDLARKVRAILDGISYK
jgi:PAS domain S-box-containing protein